MTTSGTNNFFLANSDVVLEAFDRCEIRPSEITRERMFSCKRSLNLEVQTWANRGVNLWKVALITIPLVQGVAQYTLPANTISLLDVYVRQYQLSNTTNLTPAFTTVNGSSSVTLNWPLHGLTPTQPFQIVTPIAVGGLLLQGFYQVASVVDANTVTFVAASSATASVSAGGVGAYFTTVAGQSSVSVTLTNHGLAAGQIWNVPVSTLVGGITISGAYYVTSVTSANAFTISANAVAATSSSTYMNGGKVELGQQNPNAQPVDIMLTQLSRTEYAEQSNKFTQARPTTLWFDRTTPSPSVTLWQVPDGSGPYLLSMYVLQQIQDASYINMQTADIPYRFNEALCAGLAKRLAMKYAPAKFAILKAEAKEEWDEASVEDREKVGIHITPDFSGYQV